MVFLSLLRLEDSTSSLSGSHHNGKSLACILRFSKMAFHLWDDDCGEGQEKREKGPAKLEQLMGPSASADLALIKNKFDFQNFAKAFLSRSG